MKSRSLKLKPKPPDFIKETNHKEAGTPREPTPEPAEYDIDIKNMDGHQYMDTISDGSIDLILTDPPYSISKETGMNIHYNMVKANEANDVGDIKTETEWLAFKSKNDLGDDGAEMDAKKQNFLKYGTIYGKKYCVKTDYGDWDAEFTMEQLDTFIAKFYRKLRVGGTLIIFFDLWKITPLKELLERHRFKQIRFIEWIKTNPQPLNSGINYLTNCREIALVAVKGGRPTFNSKYDNGIYEGYDGGDDGDTEDMVIEPIPEAGIYKFPIQGGKNRIHPTQKSLALFEALIEKHSKEGEVVMDTFLGGGTTAIAAKNKRRAFRGCEINKTYYDGILRGL